MRIEVGLLLLVLCSPVSAQVAGAGRGGGRNATPVQGGPSRGAGTPFPSPPFGPNFPSSFGTAVYQSQHPLWGSIAPSPPWGGVGTSWGGAGTSWGGGGAYGFPCFPGNYPASYATPFYGVYGGGFTGVPYGPGFYPPQPPANVTVVFPPQPSPVVVPPPGPVTETVLPSDALASDRAEPVPAAIPREPVIPNAYPALIVVKNGDIYSADRYWVKGKTFHFITTNGEHHQIPRSMLERLYPARKNER